MLAQSCSGWRRTTLRRENWKRWGPYLAERQWGTVREDYSADGTCWDYFPHDHARSRAYRWGEDGLLGICDREGRLCFALALWNGDDPILKERLFGLTGPEGNHGEDVKEQYFYLDSTPTHSYLQALYKYPQREFPYGGWSTRTAAAARPTPSSSWRTPASSTTAATSTCSPSTPRDRPTTSSSRSPSPTAARRRRRSPCCRRSGSATPGRGGARARATPGGRRWPRSATGRSPIEHPSLGSYRLAIEAAPARRRARAALHRERDQRRAAVRLAQRDAVREGRLPRVRRQRARAIA